MEARWRCHTPTMTEFVWRRKEKGDETCGWTTAVEHTTLFLHGCASKQGLGATERQLIDDNSMTVRMWLVDNL